MLTIKTATGKEFEVQWVGLSTLDSVLRFELISSDASEAMTVFTNKDETKIIEYYMSGKLYETYSGYTTFAELIIKSDEHVDIGLRR